MTNEQWYWLVNWCDEQIDDTFPIADNYYSLRIEPSYRNTDVVSFVAASNITGEYWIYEFERSDDLPTETQRILRAFWNYKNKNDE